MIRFILICSLAFGLAFSQDLSKYLPPSFHLKKAPAVSVSVKIPFTHGQRNQKRVALTFDACATAARSRYDSGIISTLLKTKTPATLFLCGKWGIEHQKETRSLSADTLFEIGNHSFIHPHLTKMTPERLKEELELTQNILFTITGKSPSLFRPPYGEVNDSVIRCASSLGLRTIQFDLASGDPDTSASAQKLIDYVGSAAKNGSIIVMHMNKRGWHTAEALPEIIERLRKRGFVFVKVSELLQ